MASIYPDPRLALVFGEHRCAVEAGGRHMNETTMFEWLLQLQPIGVALVLGFVPALIARWKRRRMTPWYLYGLVCALLAWPAVALPAIHALLVRRYGNSEQISPQRRRPARWPCSKRRVCGPTRVGSPNCDANRPSGSSVAAMRVSTLDRARRSCSFRERAEAGDEHAVSYRHRDVHLGYVPRRHRWIADAIDDGLRLIAIVETVKTGWVFRQRAKFVGTRIIVLHDSR
jgi:hypothetical protein